MTGREGGWGCGGPNRAPFREHSNQLTFAAVIEAPSISVGETQKAGTF